MASSHDRATMFLLYVLCSILVFEFLCLFAVNPEGVYYRDVARLTDGTGTMPFIRRRLTFDVAQGVANAVPPKAWAALRRALDADRPIALNIRARLDAMKWNPKNYPILISTYTLIYISLLGFMYASRRLAVLAYASPTRVHDAIGLAMGIAVLGAYEPGDTRYAAFPYDLPNAFMFTTTLIGIVGRRWWTLLAFFAAAYSKETSLLLIVAYLLIPRQEWTRRCSIEFVGMIVGYLTIRLAIAISYPAQGPDLFWNPARNLINLLAGIWGNSWYLPFLIVGLWRFASRWPVYPRILRRLWPLLAIEIGACFFKGWLEERRAYLEILPIAGLLVTQWILEELGYGGLMVARDNPSRSAGEAHRLGPREVSRVLDRAFPHCHGLQRAIIRYRPYICPFEEVLSRIPEGSVVLDVGCGVGMVGALAAWFGRSIRVVGFDTSDRAIAVGRAASLPDGVAWELGVLGPGQWPEGRFDAVLCVDVLHHVPPDHQRAFCSRLASSAQPGAVVLFKDMAKSPRWKMWANRLHDALIARERINERDADEVGAWFSQEGLVIEESMRIDRLWYAHYLIVARKS